MINREHKTNNLALLVAVGTLNLAAHLNGAPPAVTGAIATIVIVASIIILLKK